MNDRDNGTGNALAAADWHRLNALLKDALELDAAARSDWLATLPPAAQDLRPMLERLLAADLGDDTSQTLQPVVAMAGAAMAAMRAEQPGDRIGPWQLERLLAKGGMGTVWVAQRADGVMQRTAALKLPRAEWIDHGLSERIARERAILARLQHPYIAVLYDAGLGIDGRPYLALEYVDGRPIDAWCAGRELRDIVRLFVQVMRAVAYAHSQLVIHRDIKPSNVLVTSDGVPKLLDFGISKLLEGDAPAVAETALTRLTGRALTLAYAAPEQVLGEPVGATADVYALGVLLFELLTGTRLYRAQEPRALEAEVLQGDLRAPSTAAPDRARARQLRGDLDAVVATALKRDPAARYQSAVAFADDLERWLAGEPVRAQPDSLLYRLRKYVARNRLPVAAGGSVVLALAVGLGLALWQAGVAGEQARRATAMNEFVLSLIRQADPNASRETKAADVAMLAAIEQRIDNEFQGSPDQLLQLRITVGEAYKNRGEMMAARRVFQRAVDDAAPRLPADDLGLLTAVVRAADDRLVVSTAAGAQLARAIAVLRTKAERDLEAAELLLDALLLRIELAQTYGVPDYLTHNETTAAVAEVETLALRHFGAGSGQHLRAVRMAATLAALRRGPEAAVPVLADALELARARPGDATTSAEYLTLAADHARLQCWMKDTAGLATLRQLTDTVRAAHGASSYLLEPIYEWTAECLAATGDPTAFGWVREAYEIAASREQPPSTNLMRRAQAAFNWASGARDFEAAERYYQLALDNSRAFPEDEIRERQTIGLRNGRVCQLMQRGDAAEALQVAQPLIAHYDEVWVRIGRLTPAQGNIWICTADALRQLGRFDEAIRIADTYAERCIELKKIAPAANCEQRAYVMRALTQLDAGRVGDALATSRQHLTDAWPALLNAEAREGRAVQLYARLMIASRRAAEAVEILRADHERWLKMQPGSPYAAESLYWLGRAHLAAGDPRGRSMTEQAQQRLAQSPVATHRKLAAGQAIP